MPPDEKIKIGIEPALLTLLNRVQNKRSLMTKISGIMLDDVRENFEQEGRPQWPRLSKKTIDDRKSKGYWPGKILQRTGQLLKSITSKAGDDFSQVGTNKNYAAIHQFGGNINQAARSNIYQQQRYKRGKRKGKFKKGKGIWGNGSEFSARTIIIPARPFLKLSDSAMSEITKSIKQYLTK